MTLSQKTAMTEAMAEMTLVEKNLLRMLARKDYSEKEISEKLSEKFSPTQVNAAIKWAQEQHWLKTPQELSAKITEQLNLKLKGIEWIHQVLESKALPLLPASPELELEKARHLIKNKPETSPDKIMRFLNRHGFDMDTIGKVIDEKR